MAYNRTFTQGVRAAAKPGAGKTPTYPVPVLAVVKANVDPIRAGRIWVFISNSNALNPDDSQNWIAVRYLSPFFGSTRADSPNEGYGTFKGNPSSYGMWNSPPDIGTTVVCLFVNGDPNYGFYIGALPEPENLQMVPAIAASDNIIANEGESNSYGGAVRLPVANMNINDKSKADSPKFINEAKPVHSYQAAIMNRQGLLRDPVRGPISSSALRESPSRVGWGISTPGRPIYEGGFDDTSIADNLSEAKAKQLRVVARRGGHSIVMDDGDIVGRDQLIRIRSADGHQILMSDDAQTLFIIHKNGQSYVELGKEGTVDVYSTNSVNIRTHGDLNFHADRNVNIHAAKDFNLYAENINVQSVKAYNQLVGTNYKNSTFGNHTTQVKSAFAVEAGGQASMAASAEAFINGSKVNLNSGFCSTKAEAVSVLPLTKHTDTLYDAQKGFLAAPLKLVSITSRAPAHMPWSAAGMGVNVKTNLSSDANLPPAPTGSVSTANQIAAGSLTDPVAPATAASQPAATQVSSSIDKSTTNAILGSVATQASKGPLAAAQTTGATVANVNGAKTVGVGQFALQPSQMVGALKPGAEKVAESLIAGGAKPTAALAQNLWSGNPGTENLQSFVANPGAQAQTVVNGLKQSQGALTNAGLMTGKESASQTAGMIQSGFTNGLNTTINAIKDVGSGAGGQIGQLGTAASGALKSIASGNFAANLANELNGVMGSLTQSVSAMAQSPNIAGAIEKTRGSAAAAFSAIAASFVPLKPGVPQNLTAIAKESSLKTAAQASGGIMQDFQNSAGKVLGNQSLGLSSQLSKVAGTLATVAPNSKVGSLLGAVSGAAGSISQGQGLTSSLTNAAKGAVEGAIQGAVNNTLTNALGKTGAALAQATGISGSISGIANQSVGQITQAATSFVNPTSLASTTNDLKAAAVAAGTGALGNTPSSLAAGIDKLPGGQQAISAVVDSSANKLIGQLPPGTDKLGAFVKDQFTSSLNNLPVEPPVLDDLSALVSSGLSSGDAAQLQASMAAAGSGGAVPIKAPTLAFNTLDSAIDNSIDSLLGDPAIPKPVYNVSNKAAKAAGDKLTGVSEEKVKAALDLNEIYANARKLELKSKTAKKKYETAELQLPQGSPELTKLKEEYNQSLKAIQDYETETVPVQESLLKIINS
jgi:hypothetical protein